MTKIVIGNATLIHGGLPMTLQAPFPWFGGKSTVAPLVWARFGNVVNYVEPFYGSGAVLLGRPEPFSGSETINDKDGYVANFWRALARDPEAVAFHADNPPNENDLTARHIWLVNEGKSRVARLEGDPDYFCAKTAGWWCWGLCCWIGSEFCSGRGPWGSVAGQLVHLGNAGRGVNRKLVHLGDAGRGQCQDSFEGILSWMLALADRLRLVRVCCGDWERVCGPAPTEKLGLTGVFLDPPYSAEAGRDETIYAEEDLTVAHDVRRWCLERGGSPLMRICLAGYEGEGHEELERAGWTMEAWKAKGGYSSQGSTAENNCTRERLWFSPACLGPAQNQLF